MYTRFLEKVRELFTKDEKREKEFFDEQIKTITVACEKVPQEKTTPLYVYRVKVPGAMAEERRNRLVKYIMERYEAKWYTEEVETVDTDMLLYQFLLNNSKKGAVLLNIVTALLEGSEQNEKAWIMTGVREQKERKDTYILKLEELCLLDKCRKEDEEKQTNYLEQMTDKLSYDQLKEVFFYTMLIKIYRNQMSHANGEEDWKEDDEIPMFYKNFYEMHFNDKSPEKKFVPIVSRQEASHVLWEAVACHRRIEQALLEKEKK